MAALAAPALTLIGALGVACFVKVYGVVFLGTPQTTDFDGAVPRVPPWPGWSALTFRQKTDFRSEVPDTVLDGGALPIFQFVARLFSTLRILQQGNVQIYLMYIFLALLALLLWR